MANKQYALVFKSGARMSVEMDDLNVDNFIKSVMNCLNGKPTGADTWYVGSGYAFLASELLGIVKNDPKKSESSGRASTRPKP